jgi:YD repeat-containing protein
LLAFAASKKWARDKHRKILPVDRLITSGGIFCDACAQRRAKGKKMRLIRQGSCLWAAAMLVLSVGCYAQSATPDQEYQKLIQVDQNIAPLGEHPFGENISLYDGSVSFNVTDVSLRGNGPAITVGRTGQYFEWVQSLNVSPQLPFNNWDLDIPRIETLVATQLGWQTGLGGTNPTGGTTKRCTNFTMPPGIASTSSEGGWVPDEWWYGYNLLVPGEGKQLLMPRSTANSLSPMISGMSFSIVTKNNWMISCGVTASDGGEGFLAIAPDGTRYTFAHLIYRPWYPIIGAGALAPDGIHLAKSSTASAKSAMPMDGGPGGIGILSRQDAFMYVTKIQDRFGNTLTYNYDASTGYLSSITASDEREVDVAYVSGSPLIHTITAKATNVASRIWTYIYAPSSSDLTGVQLPDGSAWSYNLNVGPEDIEPSSNNCQLEQLPQFTYPVTGGSGQTITTPSGLTGTFSIGLKLSGRSYTPKYCYGFDNGTAPAAVYPEWYLQPAITSEVLSGAGMPTQTWTYSYSPANQSWSNDECANSTCVISCATSGTCPTTVYTDVTDPNGNDTRYTFSNRFDATEGQLLSTTYANGAAGGSLLRSETYTYANPTGGPWPTTYGSDLLYRDNAAQVTEASPLQQHSITDVGGVYTWQALAFNIYTVPNEIDRYSSATGQHFTEQMTYLNDPALWVLSLPLQTTNVITGEVESANTYYPNDTLWTRSRFGELMMTYTFNSAGQLASFEDGDNNVTSLSNYYRGIPRAISFTDGTSESLSVDDLGQIRSLTDQAKWTTNYNYDGVGRVTEIDYPTGDTVAWNPKKFSYQFITDTTDQARGLAANHWKRTITQGSDTEVTFFDAKLQPVLHDSIASDASSPDVTTSAAYDWKGKTTFASYPINTQQAISAITLGTRHAYDALEREKETDQDAEPAGTVLKTTTLYIPGAGIQVTDPKSNVTTTYYQVFDEPRYDDPIQVNAPGGLTQQNIARDIYGNPTAMTQTGVYNGTETDTVTKSLFYDSFHRLCRTTEPESGSTLTSYDNANNVLTTATGITVTGTGCGTNQVSPQALTNYTYYPMNRVHTLAPPSPAQGTLYTYDPLGRVATTISGQAIQSYGYNSLGLLTNEVLWLPNNGINWSLASGYDANGHLSSVKYPTGETVAYAPNARGEPTQAGAYATSVGYFPNGQVSQFLYGNGMAYLATQNVRQLLNSFSYASMSATALVEQLTYDNDANMTAVVDETGGVRSKSFGYDALNRLSSAVAPGLWGSESYQYDALNNLRVRATASQTLTYNYNPTTWQLANISNGASPVSTFGYDTHGNVTAKNTTQLMFDPKDQLSQVVGYDAYAYEANGRRIIKTPTSGAPVYYFYSQAGPLMYEFAPGSSQGTTYIYLDGKMVARNATLELTGPSAITFNSNPNNGNYTVSWGAVSQATSYTLQENANGGGWQSEPATSGTSMSFSGKPGGSYLYQVEACAGATCSGWTLSPTLGVTPIPSTMTVPSGVITGTYTVSWSASTGATGYTVQESFNGGAWSTIATNTTALSITRPGTVGGTYTYQVMAINTYGNRGWAASAPVSVTQVPAPPTNIIATAGANGQIIITWDAMPFATTYMVEVYGTNGALGEYLYNVATNSFNMPGQAPGKYSLTVSACSIAGCSAAVSNKNGPITLLGSGTSPTMQQWANKAAHMLGMDGTTSSGCTATQCTVASGDTP